MKTNHPAHGPVSLDRLHQIREILSKAAAQSDGGNLGYAMADAVKVIDGVLESLAREQVRCEHAAWSLATFGDVGPVGPLKHLSKEALEAAAEPGDLSEWADMQFLLWDGQRRAGISDEQITKAMVEKLAVNKQREWPEPKDGEPRLHIKEQPAPVVPEYPETLPCPVLLEPGMRFGKGVKTRLVLEAIQRRAEHYAELEAMTPEQRAEHDAGIEAIKAMLPKPAQPDIEMLASALTNAPLAPSDRQGRPRAPVVPEECKEAPAYVKALTKEGAYIYGFNACRAAMLQAGNSPVTPDGYVLVPKKITAENGAKGVLSGEFSETKFINCPECFGDDDCETCDGSGRIEITVPVTWTTIKAIWAKGVEHLAAAPQQEVK